VFVHALDAGFPNQKRKSADPDKNYAYLNKYCYYSFHARLIAAGVIAAENAFSIEFAEEAFGPSVFSKDSYSRSGRRSPRSEWSMIVV
jgi:hypothetical protein